MKRGCLMIAVVLFLVILLRSPSVSARSDIDGYIQSEMKMRQIPGLALAVIHEGAVVKQKGYGVANLEHEVPVTPDTVFELASVTKQFTAAAIMLLLEGGKIGLSDPVSHYMANSPTTWKGITVRHLLTHTAGLASLKNGFKALFNGGMRTNYTTAQMFEAATKDPMSFAPGERWQYSDVGFFLLGMIIEKVSGQRYRDFLGERFFKPLGMTETSVLDQLAIVKNRAAGYTLHNGQLVNIRRVSQPELSSHYGVFSSARDLVKWENALSAGKVLKQSSLEQMWTPVKFNNGSSFPYGFGWFVDERLGHRMITHTGITGTEYTRFPDDKLTVIVLTNLGQWVGRPRVNAWGLTQGVAGRYVPGLLFSSLKEQPQTNQPPTMTIQGALSGIASGEGSTLIVRALNSALSQERRSVVAGHLKDLKSFTFLTCEDVTRKAMERNGARISRLCYYKLVTETETRYYKFWLTADDQIAEYQSFKE